MSEIEFEIIESSSVELPVRRRKKKIDPQIAAIRMTQESQDEYWKREARLLLSLSRINERRQMLRSGSYNEDDNPYSHLVDARYKYEIEMETVFHSDISDVKTEEDIEAFLDDFYGVFAECSELDEDSPTDEVQQSLREINRLRTILDSLIALFKEDDRLHDALDNIKDIHKHLIKIW
jgi:hypothetical protein